MPIGIPITYRKTELPNDKKVNSETKLSTREVCVPHGHPIIRPEVAKIIVSNEAFPFRVKKLFPKHHEVGF